MIRLLLTWITGFKGMPIPYSPKLDDGITILLLCCFFISAYVLSRSRKFLVQLMKDFLLNRERTSIFAATTAADMRYMLLLILQTCVLGAGTERNRGTAAYRCPSGTGRTHSSLYPAWSISCDSFTLSFLEVGDLLFPGLDFF